MGRLAAPVIAAAAAACAAERLGAHEVKLGAQGQHMVDEQTHYRVPGNSHTARHAAVELLYCQTTGGPPTRSDLLRVSTWAIGSPTG
jgi:hypothetical protein